jgi:hypothetical protein
VKLRLPGRRDRAETTADTPSTTADGPTSDGLGGRVVVTSGKGRPTPKRNVAQGRRPGPPPPPPTTRKEAYKRMREQQAARRADTRAGMARGDDSYLPARDRGPERKLVRDVVDSRRNVGSFFLLIAFVALIGALAPSLLLRAYSSYVLFAFFIVLIIDSVVLRRRIKAVLAQRFPETTKTRGHTWYGISRSTMIRRWRFPKPEVRVGAQI